jgi:hypothetical protein
MCGKKFFRIALFCVIAAVVGDIAVRCLAPSLLLDHTSTVGDRCAAPTVPVESCLSHSSNRRTLVHGPGRFHVRSAASQFDRNNLVVLDNACRPVHLSSLSLPTEEFVRRAGRACIGVPTNESVCHRFRSHIGPSRHLFYLVYAASRFAGHSLELLLDSIGSLTAELLSPTPAWDRVTVITYDYLAVGLEFASEYSRMARDAASAICFGNVLLQFEVVSLRGPLLLCLEAGDSLLYTSPMIHATPCQVVSQHVYWKALLASMPPRESFHRIVLLKTNSSLTHHTPLFFSFRNVTSFSDAGFELVPEGVPKVHRMWLLNQARVIVDSAGANADINRLLMVPRNKADQVCWITLVHRDSHLVSLCRSSVSTPVPGFRRMFVCPRTTNLTMSDLTAALKLCDV